MGPAASMEQVEWWVQHFAPKITDVELTIWKAADLLSCGLDSILEVLTAEINSKKNLDKLIRQRECDLAVIEELRKEIAQLKKKLKNEQLLGSVLQERIWHELSESWNVVMWTFKLDVAAEIRKNIIEDHLSKGDPNLRKILLCN
jgi:hypothetical protein